MPEREGLVRRLPLLGVVAAMLVAGAAGAFQAFADSVTYDERGYLQAGSCTARGGAIDEIDTTNPPLFRIPAGVVVDRVDERTSGCEDAVAVDRPPAELRRLVLAARLPSVAVSVALVGIVGLWVAAMAGRLAGVAAALVTALEPTLVGHGHVVSGDAWMAAGAVGALAAAWASRRASGTAAALAWAAFAGAALGFGLLGKVSALAIGPAVLVAELADRGPVRRTLLRAVVAAVATFVVLWAPYLVWDQRSTDADGGALPRAELGLPGSWVRGIRFQLDHAREGAGDSNWFAGEQHPAERLPLYYLTGLVVKASPLLLAGVAAAVVTGARRRPRRGRGRGTGRTFVDLALPALVFVAVPSVGVIHIGIRYVLPAFALLAGVAGVGLARVVASTRGRTRAVAAGVALVLVVPSAAAARHSGISYFNPLAGGEPERLLADSNLDWGQDAWRVRRWWSDAGRPELVDATFGPLPLSTYGVDVIDGDGACGDLVAVSRHRQVLGQVPPLGAEVVELTPATAAYRRAC